ncbi:DUF1707 SHOCT-like domain-containing protein [Thermoactinospora rubra]|uniref:DUF1707 SHOCT-like domain-containing protein n=1 Tax=Thermoactinospora rubra TaxID=1088767 RepID=UPI000A105E38|nr:DUF1707 domain-containing protein [Thermoactinospora rubra]
MEPRTLVSDEERGNALQRLQQAFADGRLELGEMEERLERVLTARTLGDLLPAVADLPEEEAVELASTGGHIRRTGAWRVPRRLRVRSEFGKVRLDLSRALIRHPVIAIELRLTYGSATVVLPPGATVNADRVRTVWGSVTCKADGPAQPGRPYVEISGELEYGSLRVRTARK